MLRNAGTAACVLLVAQALVFGQSPIDLGTLGGSTSQATAIDNLSRAAGSADEADGTTHAFTTDRKDAKLVDIGVLNGGSNSYGLGASLSGVVGYSELNDPIVGFTTHAFYYNLSSLRDLGTLGGTTSQANGVNDRGLVVGTSIITDNVANHAFAFDSSKNQLTDLGTLGGTNSSAYAVNDLDQVVGVSDTGKTDDFGNPISHAVIWDIKCGKTIDIGTLPGDVDSQANAVNQLGVVVGTSTSSLGVTRGFLYFHGKLTDLGSLGGSYTQPNAINDFGVVVGVSNVAGDSAADAFVWTPWGGIQDLNSYLPANSGWSLSSANGIDDLFKVAGAGVLNGNNHGFVFQVTSLNKK